MRIFILDCEEMTTKEKTYEYIAEQLRFPDYFGENLDALADCLSEFNDDNIIILLHHKQLLEGRGKYGEKILEVFEEIAGEEASYILIKK